jgi:hypothetical protein
MSHWAVGQHDQYVDLCRHSECTGVLGGALAEHLQHLAQGAADGEGGAEAADEAA